MLWFQHLWLCDCVQSVIGADGKQVNVEVDEDGIVEDTDDLLEVITASL